MEKPWEFKPKDDTFKNGSFMYGVKLPKDLYEYLQTFGKYKARFVRRLIREAMEKEQGK